MVDGFLPTIETVLLFVKFADGLTDCGWLVCDETDENRKPDGFDDILSKLAINRSH